ncbi:noxC [Symbiodinium natans]|uniref:NoxC protein n=1 Tax=Symbiodinium natans TaxID=878477 RepID=A0A812TKC2_9DINO|nr:noxC [Symbiodinium natans]
MGHAENDGLACDASQPASRGVSWFERSSLVPAGRARGSAAGETRINRQSLSDWYVDVPLRNMLRFGVPVQLEQGNIATERRPDGMSQHQADKAGAPLDEATLDKIEGLVFKDDRWERALKHLNAEPGWGKEAATQLLRRGAETFGFWQLPDEALNGLVGQLLQAAPKPSTGIRQWTQEWAKGQSMGDLEPAGPLNCVVPVDSYRTAATSMTDNEPRVHVSRTIATSRFSHTPTSDGIGIETDRFATNRVLRGSKTKMLDLPDWTGHFINTSYLRMISYGLHLLVFLSCLGYASDLITNKYPNAVTLFSWPIFFARLGGMACAIYSALLFLSMSRGLLSLLSRCLPKHGRNLWFTFLDSHKDLHIECGKALVFYSALHTVGHCIGTVPGVLQKSAEELNALLGCAQEDPPYVMHLDLSIFHWPRCPLLASEKPMNFTEALFLTLPGLTGFLLILVLGVVAWTSRHRYRAARFEVFWNLHNVAIVSWPVLLFFHGSQGWIGIGVPLVLVVVSLPILFYAVSRIARLLRYYLFVGRAVQILRATTRLGKDGSMNGALTQLEISAPPYLWRFHAGMYAFICMPDYAKLQWHPFTITSGKDDATVNFIIAGIGDWTQELARRCLNAAEGKAKMPRVALDGPFTAPTQSAMDKKVLVAVGAGVGVTPFLSLLSTLMAQLLAGHSELVEAHFYWVTRDASEFVFGWQILRRWLRHPVLQSRIFIHLYNTGSTASSNLPAFLFRQAVKHQSAVDLEHFQSSLSEWQAECQIQNPGPQFPWCWAEGGREELLWIKCPSWQSEGVADKFHRVGTKDDYVSSSSDVNADHTAEDGRMIPVTFGRPNFLRDISSIGKARPEINVHVYICGNDTIVQDLTSVCQQCSAVAAARSREDKRPLQKYIVHFERFG